MAFHVFWLDFFPEPVLWLSYNDDMSPLLGKKIISIFFVYSLWIMLYICKFLRGGPGRGRWALSGACPCTAGTADMCLLFSVPAVKGALSQGPKVISLGLPLLFPNKLYVCRVRIYFWQIVPKLIKCTFVSICRKAPTVKRQKKQLAEKNLIRRFGTKRVVKGNLLVNSMTSFASMWI